MPKKVQCIQCGTDTFSRKKQPFCKPCDLKRRASVVTQTTRERQREHTLKTKYGIDNVDFECLWQAFRGKCGLCDSDLIMPISGMGQPKNAAVIDHDHVTGNIRGILCNSCNKGIGLLKDDSELCLKASVWLNYSRN